MPAVRPAGLTLRVVRIVAVGRVVLRAEAAGVVRIVGFASVGQVGTPVGRGMS